MTSEQRNHLRLEIDRKVREITPWDARRGGYHHGDLFTVRRTPGDWIPVLKRPATKRS